MSKIPTISIDKIQAYTGQQNHTGSICNAYAPLKNLENAKTSTLGNFTTEELNFDLLHPVDIVLQDSYDGAVNIVLNDGKNVPRLINSRFSVIDGKEFKIPEHTGHKNTNIYDENTFDIDTSLKAIALKIPQIEYRGMTQFAGSLPCGAYTFYFKLADADGNESEVLAESGIVQVYIGDTALPDINIRMGLEDENSGKSINFKITNIDSGFDYVHVLYTRSSSGNDLAATDTYHKIIFDYPVSNEECEITITGNEQIIGISAEELYTDYADIEAVKSLAVVNNVLFFGNIKKLEHDWNALRIASWKITYSCGAEANIGSIDKNYTLIKGKTDEDYGLYYNTYNSYYKIGYWPDEIYRFGIVYIFEDNSLSPVFNLQGVDFQKLQTTALLTTDAFQYIGQDQLGNNLYRQWETSPEDYYFDKTKGLNSKGVIKFPKSTTDFTGFKSSFGGIITPLPLYIKFDLHNIAKVDLSSTEDEDAELKAFFKKHKIKGYFFVRQRRIPTILAQGVAVGLTKKDNGAVPIIKLGEDYKSQSFLSNDQLLQREGRNVLTSKASVNALYVPDAELSEATFNLLFVSNKYTLDLVAKYTFADNYANANHSYVQIIKARTGSKHKRKLTNVPEDTKTLTDGEMYFSTIAGNPSEPYKTADIRHVWDHTPPLTLTMSDSLIRGNWGCFVGVGEDSESDGNLVYGEVYNIKLENYYDDEDAATELDFKLRMEREDSYQAICDRTEISKLEMTCYRGDCYQSLFTHRVMRNFADPELPTNDKIINPMCWALNYAVRCTALTPVSDISNLKSESEGWSITNSNQNTFANEVALAFEVWETNADIYSKYKWDPDTQAWYDGDTFDSEHYVGPTIGGAYPVSRYVESGALKLVKPSEQESSGIGGILKNIFKSSRWALRGLANINRADVNAVGLGQWITFPICSSKNLALRDIDYSNATEQAAFNRKRSFYPLLKMDVHNPLRDSNVINLAAGISLPHKRYYLIPNVPFIKQEYFTRVLNSLRDSANSITNEFKVMLESAYKDYTKIHGPITKLVPFGSKMIVVFHHGIGVLALNDSMSQAENALLYLPAELSMVVSPDYGSMWKDSIIETPKGIYGVDTVAKVIWKISPGDVPQLQLISNFKIEKFLIDNIDLSEFTTSPFVGRINVKSHYNAFKLDVIFTYYNDTLYKFNNILLGLDEKGNKLTLPDFDITSDGYLLNKKDHTLYEFEEGIYVLGEKVKAYYDEDKGELIDYSKQLDAVSNDIENEYNNTFKWAHGKSWSLCFNEVVDKFITFYDWIPVESENIDNIWFSFDREATNKLADLGYGQSLSQYIAPSGNLKDIDERTDYKYGLNAIDPTFNTSAPITYFDDTYKIEFPITYTYQKDKVTVAGFYLKNGANYHVLIIRKVKKGRGGTTSISLSNVPFPLSGEDGWTFVPVHFYKQSSSSKQPYYIVVSLDPLIGETLDYYNYAVSHVIVDDITNPAWTSEEEIGAKKVGMEDLPNYYTVRTLSDSLPLWKHGQAGLYDNADELKPTFWYGLLHEFNFEFIARQDAMHKVFNNLLIISNKAEPHKFEFEVVGEVYDWHKYKPVLKWIADLVDVATDNPKYESKLNNIFVEVLTNKYGDLKRNHSDFPRIFGMKDNEYFEKLPYLKVTDACVPTLDPQIIGEKIGTKDDNIYLPPEWYDTPEGEAHSDNTVSCCLVYDKLLNEFRVHTELLGNDVWKYGRLRGNMQYLEDLWRIEIRPVSFKYAYVHYIVDDNGDRIYETIDEYNPLPFTRLQETRHRDKYIKIKIRYSGEDLAVIQAINTLFDYSYA